MPFERVMGPNQHNMENYGDLQHIASENLSFGLLPYDDRLRVCTTVIQRTEKVYRA